jgi:hypothetical protein
MQLASVSEGHNVETYREAAAKRIKQLMHDWTANTLALAAELAQAADTFPVNAKRPDQRPGFAKWAVQATGLSKTQINNLFSVHKNFGHRQHSGRAQLAQNVMFILSRSDVPESARIEALDRAERGEHVGHKDAKKIAKVHKLPSAKDANEQAKEEGRPILARDGYIYFGTDLSRAKEGEDRRTMVYGVRKALDTLGNIQLTGHQFLDYALPHQLWDKDEAKIIKQALRWLTSLDEAWDRKE